MDEQSLAFIATATLFVLCFASFIITLIVLAACAGSSKISREEEARLEEEHEE